MYETATKDDGSENSEMSFADFNVMPSAMDDDSMHSHSESSIQSTTSSVGGEEIARREARAVSCSKLILVGFITTAIVLCAVYTYKFSVREDDKDFEVKFYGFAEWVANSVQEEVQNFYNSVSNVATTITSYTLEKNLVWPNVSIPHFELRGELSNDISKALHLSLVPLVAAANRRGWESYAVENQGWIHEGVTNGGEYIPSISQQITRYTVGQDGDILVPELARSEYGPVWQQAPTPNDPYIINYNLLSHPLYQRVYESMRESKLPVMSEVSDFSFLYAGGSIQDDVAHIHSALLHPIYPDFNTKEHRKEDIVGFLTAILPWGNYFLNILPEGVNGIIVVLHDTCGDHFTFQVNGPDVVFLGEGDLHDPKYNQFEVSKPFTDFIDHDYCQYEIRIFPSETLEAQFTTNKAATNTIIIVLVFVFTATVFLLYDYFVQRRQSALVATARRTNRIVSSLFPSNIRDRLLQNAEEEAKLDVKNKRKLTFGAAPKTELKNFLAEGQEKDGTYVFETKPIADLFPSTTIMFADIAGFTAWSSVREPAQVFTLLETVYHAFDEIAKSRRVFKVETVGDCYVAVCGLPYQCNNHATVMAKFARDCLDRMNDLTKRLEITLGPDTGDLSLRIGLHSGPVTAGVLRGDKSRFQLFGDSVNTAARIESNGERNKIHLSQETADQLIAGGKSHWVEERVDKVVAKGKGEIQTYWLRLGSFASGSVSSGDTDDSSDSSQSQDVMIDSIVTKQEESKPKVDDKQQRLVHWNTEVLVRLLKQIVSRRKAHEAQRMKADPSMKPGSLASDKITHQRGETVLDEVQEIIHLPKFNAEAAHYQEDPESIELGENVVNQLREYVTLIATMYRDNPFHNFEHASHVTMSVVKLLSRIVAPDASNITDVKSLHDHTYGITSDPLTQFACVFSGLIHDVDHTGVPNSQLVKEGAAIAHGYKGKSVAEQNSVDVAWDLLMDVNFEDLRQAIYTNEAEMRHFREVVVNSVMATDIMDKELGNARKARWNKAFSESPLPESESDAVNRKATIVIEHLIQASDISHTMQHWHIYRKWNERLFDELYKAYMNGRSETDPSENWYKGEIGFFDFYIIPLAKKLSDCGIFGVSSDEFLNYAEKNRAEWEMTGQEIVAKMVEKKRIEYNLEVPAELKTQIHEAGSAKV